MEELLEKKMKTPEIGTGKRIDELNKWIEQEICVMKILAEKADNSRERSWEKLDSVFLDLLGKGE